MGSSRGGCLALPGGGIAKVRAGSVGCTRSCFRPEGKQGKMGPYGAAMGWWEEGKIPASLTCSCTFCPLNSHGFSPSLGQEFPFLASGFLLSVLPPPVSLLVCSSLGWTLNQRVSRGFCVIVWEAGIWCPIWRQNWKERENCYYLLVMEPASSSCSCPLKKSCSMNLQRSKRFGTPTPPCPPAAHKYFIQNGCSPHSLLSEQMGFGWIVKLHGSKGLWLSSLHLSRKGTLYLCFDLDNPLNLKTPWW